MWSPQLLIAVLSALAHTGKASVLDRNALAPRGNWPWAQPWGEAPANENTCACSTSTPTVTITYSTTLTETHSASESVNPTTSVIVSTETVYLSNGGQVSIPTVYITVSQPATTTVTNSEEAVPTGGPPGWPHEGPHGQPREGAHGGPLGWPAEPYGEEDNNNASGSTVIITLTPASPAQTVGQSTPNPPPTSLPPPRDTYPGVETPVQPQAPAQDYPAGPSQPYPGPQGPENTDAAGPTPLHGFPGWPHGGNPPHSWAGPGSQNATNPQPSQSTQFPAGPGPQACPQGHCYPPGGPAAHSNPLTSAAPADVETGPKTTSACSVSYATVTVSNVVTVAVHPEPSASISASANSTAAASDGPSSKAWPGWGRPYGGNMGGGLKWWN
ncbi:hypothetical protein GQ53DRAFT_831808 [Thozetella sp. PMI_491]|nr:hypothetical protein GQ53DRAFT_831808 [Thozetella sp. PMI_491]